MPEERIQVVILGAGVIGLTVAHVLSEDSRYRIKIVARDLPGDLDSQGFASPWAGANWSPMEPAGERIYRWEKATYDKFWSLIPSGLAMACPGKDFFGPEQDVDAANIWYKDLARDFKTLSADELPPGAKAGTSFQTVSVCPTYYLPWLQSELLSRGVEFVRKFVPSLGDAAALAGPHGVLVNAMGLGARSLIGLEDKDVYPVRGQTIVIDNPKVNESMGMLDLMSSEKITYIIPRPSPNGHTTILGGLYQGGNWDTSFNADDARGILERCTALVPAIADKETRILKHNVGLRPARKGGPRVEVERVSTPLKSAWFTDVPAGEDGSVLVVHAYGFGSAGYQRSWGAAEEVCSLISSHLKDVPVSDKSG